VDSISNFESMLASENKKLFENYMNLIKNFADNESDLKSIKKLLDKYKRKFHEAYNTEHSFSPIYEGYWHNLFMLTCNDLGISVLDRECSLSNSSSFSLTKDVLERMLFEISYYEIF
jgi:hypothetical protein